MSIYLGETKIASLGGGSGIDKVARAAIEEHAGNSAIHLTEERIESAISEHNTSVEAHSGFQKELMKLESDVSLLKLKYNTNITANPFTVTFETADGIALDGVYNTVRGTIDF